MEGLTEKVEEWFEEQEAGKKESKKHENKEKKENDN